MCFTKHVIFFLFSFFSPSLDWQQFFTVTTHGGVAPWLGEINLRAGLCPGFLRGSPLGRGGWFASTPRGTLILTRQHCARGGTVASAVARTTERWITGCGNMERVRKQRERESLFGRAVVSYHRFVWILARLIKNCARPWTVWTHLAVNHFGGGLRRDAGDLNRPISEEVFVSRPLHNLPLPINVITRTTFCVCGRSAQITHLSRCPCARPWTSDRSHVNLVMPCMATATQWCVSGWIKGF